MTVSRTIVVRVDVIVSIDAEPLAQQAAERVRVGGADLDEEAVLAGDVMHFEDLGDRGDAARGVRFGPRLFVGAHEDVGEQAEAPPPGD